MPVMDGFELLHHMAENHWIDDIPVIMISSEDSSSSVKKAYEMGVSDYISRPFDARVVYRRVFNTIKLYAKQRRLISMISEQVREKDKNNSMMVSILSQIVEFRNGESAAMSSTSSALQNCCWISWNVKTQSTRSQVQIRC